MPIFKIILGSLIITGLFFSSIFTLKALAEGQELINISGSPSNFFRLFTQYVSRSYNQSDEHPTIQESSGQPHNSNVLLSVWGNYGDSNDNDQSNTEIDLNFGYQKEVFGVTFDVGGTYNSDPGAGTLYYTDPIASDDYQYDLFEYEFGLSYEFSLISMSSTIYYTPEYSEGVGNMTNVNYEAQIPLLRDLAAIGHIAYQWIMDETAIDQPDYMDWTIGLIYPTKEFDLSLEYASNDLSIEQCVDGCDSTITFNVIRNF